MPRATKLLAAGHRHEGLLLDTLILNAEQRQDPHGTYCGVNGLTVDIALAEPVRLRSGDCLVLDEGGLVEIVGEAEPLVEVRAPDLPALARLAWHLGDRHVPVQILERRLRLRRDPAIEALLAGLGAKLTPIEAPFDQEGGAYAAHHDHAGDHHGHHDHGHHDHRHGHDHHHDDRHGHSHAHDHAHDRHEHGHRHHEQHHKRR